MGRINRSPKYNPLILTLVIFSLVGIGYFVLRSFAATGTAPTPATRPFVKLFSQGNGSFSGDPTTAANTLSQYFSHIHGEGSDPNSFVIKKTGLGSKLIAKGMWASQYRNGSYISQASGTSDVLFNEANSIEKTAPLTIGTFWSGDYNAGKAEAGVGVLTSALDGTTTSILLNQSTKKPTGTATTWPFLNSQDSNGDGYSNSTADYVSWIRVDNEIMQITAVPVMQGAQVKLTLKRGIWGTSAVSHGSGARVFSPVYIGSTEMSGAPNQNSATIELRYSLKFWLPEGYRWQADQILKTLGDGKTYAQGGKLVEYDTVWLDVSSCNQYNLADAWGNAVNNWDDLNSERMTKDNWGKYQGWKLNGQNNAGGGLRDLVKHQNPAVTVKFTGNSMLKPGSACDRNLLANVYDGGPLEGWLKTDYAGTMSQSFDIQQSNLPGLYWVRYDYATSEIPGGDPIAYKRFAYGSYLLSYNKTSTKPQFGMTWGFAKPEDLFFYDFGTATSNTTSLTDVAISGKTNLYRRDYSNGIVLVNSGTTDQTYTLDKAYYQVGNDTALASINSVSGTITVKAQDSAFLLNPVSTTPPTGKVGDINGDNSVNITDLSLLLSSYGSTGSNPADLDKNGTVNITDLSILLSHYGT